MPSMKGFERSILGLINLQTKNLGFYDPKIIKKRDLGSLRFEIKQECQDKDGYYIYHFEQVFSTFYFIPSNTQIVERSISNRKRKVKSLVFTDITLNALSRIATTLNYLGAAQQGKNASWENYHTEE